MGITAHLRDFEESRLSKNVLFEAMIEELQKELRAYIRDTFPKVLNATSGVTDFLDQAFAVVSTHLDRNTAAFSEFNTERMHAFLRGVLEKKLSEARRYALAKKRNPNRVESNRSDLQVSKDLEGVEKLVARDTSMMIRVVLVDEKDKVNALINVLWYVDRFSTRQIEEILRLSNNNKRLRSTTSIGLQIVKLQKRLFVRLKELGLQMDIDEE